MSKIKLSIAIKIRHWKYFKEHIYERIEEKCSEVDNNILRWFYQYCNDKSRCMILAIGEYKELLNFQRELESAFELAFPNDGTFANVLDTHTEIRDDIIAFFGYKYFTSTKNVGKWSAYEFVGMLGLRVCSYCNRQYITMYKANNGRMRADIDHFLPKSKYPYFSMSIYNLVLSCALCNRSFKGKKVLTENAPNPYEHDYNRMYYFYIDLPKIDCDDGCIRVVPAEESINEILSMFHIKQIYQVHSNIAKEFIQKSISYPPELVENLIKNTPINLYSNELKLQSALLGYPCKEDIYNDVLGKLKYDFAIQTGLANRL